ncbi:MAG: ParB/RepB/Spo0J family partition protein [Oscillospiraceae bacterium]|nr:ParB/RepB/Spo0J family partition protein [Oscillospiraceae bacterium]
MTKRKSDFTLPTLDDLFSSQAERDDAKLERVREIPLCELHPFKDHPFKIMKGEEMDRMIESIRKVGAITPGLARPLSDGGYELISGHRRLAACQVLELETMPVIVREMTDDEAVIAMVDANLQREKILPSEKAFAYKMKLDAIKHQGVTSAQVGQKLLSVEVVANDAGESRNQIKRYIRLTYLIPELLAMVDENNIALNPAVEISYLYPSEQKILLDAMALNDCTPSHAQAIRLKKMAQDGFLTTDLIYTVMAEEKPNQQEQIKLKRDEISRFFPSSYTDEQIRRDIVKGLELLKRQRERNRGAR